MEKAIQLCTILLIEIWPHQTLNYDCMYKLRDMLEEINLSTLDAFGEE